MSAINEKAVNGTQLQRTHKKIYRHLMPLLIVAYIISFIDRTNIGMAKATMSVDIGLSATAFGIGAGLFFSPTQCWRSPVTCFSPGLAHGAG